MPVHARRTTTALLATAALLATPVAHAQVAPGSLRGVVYDSVAAAPLAGALVQAAPAGNLAAVRSVTADSLGRFRLDSLPPGRWLLGFDHPTVQALSLDMPTRAVDVPAGDSTSLTLALPGPRVLHRALCGTEGGDSTSSIAGTVRDAESGNAVAGAKASIAWAELVIEGGGIRRVVRRVPVQVRPDGTYLVCGVPSDAELSMVAEAPGVATGEVMVPVRGGALTRQDLGLGAVATATSATPGDSARRDSVPRVRGAARLTGTVRDDRGRPIAGARVLVLGVEGLGASTSQGGTFALDSLPPGTWTVEARAIGFEPTRRTAQLSRSRAASASIVMPKHVAVLDRVVVRGELSQSVKALTDALERTRRLGGRLITPAEIERRQPLYPSDLFRTIPGMQVRPSSTGPYSVVRGRGGCTPSVFVDGLRIQDGADDIDEVLTANDVMAVEVYRGAETPVQYAGMAGGGCGALVIWTKR